MLVKMNNSEKSKINLRIRREKGQTFEILGFVVLAVAIIILTTILKSGSIRGYTTTIKELYETQEGEGFRAGVNSILYMTEQKTGKTMLELIGIAALIQNDTIYFGPTIGSINVSEEVKKRFDAIYGQNHWKVNISFDIPPARGIQIVIVADTSGSLCDDVNELRQLPQIIDALRARGKDVSARLFLLRGSLSCCEGTINCGNFKFTDYFDCKIIEQSQNCTLTGWADDLGTDEDWGNGLACAIAEGPKGGWNEYSFKIGIPLSDELPGGSETCTKDQNSAQYKSLQNGINAAKNISMIVYPFKAVTGKECCPSCNCGYSPSCGICFVYMGSKYHNFTSTQCNCDSTLEWYMSTIANETGGKMIALKDASQIIDALINITMEIDVGGLPYLEIGYPIPERKNIRAVTLFVPTPAQRFVELRAWQWS
ncbi:MAG: hypothetical protein QXL09_01755 [Candidatus Aenigmatarchaeota archaeon]